MRGIPREVWALVAVAFAVAVGFGIVAPALPLFAREFGVGRTAAAAVVSIFAATRLVSALGTGRIVDRYGERLILALGIAIVAVSSALAGLAQSYLQLLLLRGAGGVGSAMFSISATTLLLRSVGPQLRARAQGMFQGGFLLGGIAGPAVGGVIAAVSLRAPFFVYAGTLAVAGTVGLLLLPRHLPYHGTAQPGEDQPGEDQSGEEPAPQRTRLTDALRLPAYRSALTAKLADNWAVLGVRAAIVPLFVAEGLDAEPIWTGVGFVVIAVATAVTLLPAGHYADTVGRRPVLIVGAWISVIGMLALALTPSLAGYLLAMVVLGIGAGMLGVAPAAIVGDVVVGRGGTVVAAYSMAGDVGSMLGPLIAGALAQSYGFGTAFGSTAGVLVLAGLLALRAPETGARAERRAG